MYIKALLWECFCLAEFIHKKDAINASFLLAPGHGFEPRLDDPESPVLPLDDPGMLTINIVSL